MGGSILVSKQRGLPTSTADFDYLTERIRTELLSLEPSIVSQVYEPMDGGGMTFICLYDLDAMAYQGFLQASKLAQSKAIMDGSFAKRAELWHDLFEILEGDSRILELS